jgi:hypothetical protein
MNDIHNPVYEAEVLIHPSPSLGKMEIWINVDGICVLRIGHLDISKFKLDYNPVEILDNILPERTP